MGMKTRSKHVIFDDDIESSVADSTKSIWNSVNDEAADSERKPLKERKELDSEIIANESDSDDSAIEEVSLGALKQQEMQRTQQSNIQIKKLQLAEKQAELERKARKNEQRLARKALIEARASEMLPIDVLEIAEAEENAKDQSPIKPLEKNKHIRSFKSQNKTRKRQSKISFLDSHYLYKTKVASNMQVAVVSTEFNGLSPLAIQPPNQRTKSFSSMPMRQKTTPKVAKSRVNKSSRVAFIKQMAYRHGGDDVLAKTFVSKKKITH